MENLIVSEKLGEHYYKIIHDSGLKIIIYPMEGHSSVYGILNIAFGSVDTEYEDGNGERHILPMGSAHFLEHKALESCYGDAFEAVSSLGVDMNAYTSSEKTAFFFSGKNNWEKSLEILLKYIQEPLFDEGKINKERNIISKEIKMFEDDCDWIAYKNLLDGMFHYKNLSAEPAGDLKSLKEIDKSLLEKIYRTFYNLNNMTLILSGGVDKDKIIEIADKVLHKADEFKINKIYPEEAPDIEKKYIESYQSVSEPIFNFAFKIDNDFENNVKSQIIYEILLDIIAGDATDFYREMYEQGIINSSFDAEVYNVCGFNALIFTGESKDPKKIKDLVCERICKLKTDGIEKELFNGLKKAAYGKYISIFSSAESIANAISFSEEFHENIYDTLDIISNLTIDEVNDCLRTRIFTENSVLSIIKNKLEE